MGADSDFWGYTQFVTQGWNASAANDNNNANNNNNADCPPFTAPNAWRHWTFEQRQYLLDKDDDDDDDSHQLATSLQDYSDRQLEQWKQKYEALAHDDHNHHQSNMTLSQFQWAMEAVHSRAFAGPAIASRSTAIGSLIAPSLASAVAGLLYLSHTPEPSSSPLVWTVLALVAAMPWARTVWAESAASSSSSTTTAVLLPMIDSANHWDEAGPDTTIAYDPVTDCFQLYIGPKCIDPITQQLFISYGTKTDAEWLLNYGFLPGVGTTILDDENEEVDEAVARDRQRKQLAQAFLARNHKGKPPPG